MAWRNRVALRLLRAFAAIFALSLVLIVATMHGHRERIGLMIAAIAALAIVGVPAVTGRPSGAARAWLVIAPAMVVPIFGFMFAGFLSGPGVSLTVTLLLAGLLLGPRAMIGLTLFALAAISLVAWAIVTKHLPPPNPHDHDMTLALPWARSLTVTFLAISVFGGSMIAVVARMERSLRLARQETRLRERAEQARAEAERAALESKQLELVGRLAAGVAHDFNNSLTVIIGNAELIRHDLGARGEELDLAEGILHSSRRLAELTKQLLAYSRKARMVKTPIDLHAVVRGTLSLVRRSAHPNLEIVTRLDAPSATVSADVTLIESAILNLFVNAIDAMPDGGTLTIATTAVILSVDAGEAKGMAPGPALRLEVRDTGAGIAPDVLPHIFDPFFTTKPVGGGTGLGLAAVAGTIKAHGGKVEVESAVGAGATFRVFLPAGEPRAAATPAPIEEAVRGDGHILLVEDDAMVSLTAVATLESLGYRVTRAADGEAATELVRAQPRGFDLVLLDLRMPGWSGEETFTRMRAIVPALKVLVWSGYAAEQDVGGMLARGAVGFVQKPYRVAELSRAIARALGKR
ncbi:MAG TPA: ATP-binding protein [Polyangia bacterium]|nr:ATP-binding protein [Polyangia bacterium]